MNTDTLTEQYAHVRKKKEKRDVYASDGVYSIAVEETDEGYVAFERDGQLEALGNSPAAAIANYAQAVEVSSDTSADSQGAIADD